MESRGPVMTGRRSLEKLRSPPIVLGVLRVADVLVVMAAAWVSFAIRHGVADWPFGYVVVTMIGAIITANMLHAARLYVFEDLTKLPIQVYRLSMALPAVLLILLAFGFFTKTSEEFSRLWAAGWFGLSFVGIVGLRGFVAMRLRVWQRRGWLRRNLVIIGADDASMLTAARAVGEMGGGLAIVEGEQVLARLPLPVAGLMSDQPVAVVRAAYDELLAAAAELGSPLHDPFMAMSFMVLEVIPKLKLTDKGLVDVEAFGFVELFVKDDGTMG